MLIQAVTEAAEASRKGYGDAAQRGRGHLSTPAGPLGASKEMS